MITPERWRAIEPLLDAALDLPESERVAYVTEQCGDDSVLRGELTDLLAQMGTGDRELDEPARTLWMRLLDPSTSDAPRIPERLSERYRIEAEIARGGMGVVYRAFDERVQRPVAIKVLRTDGSARLHTERFLAEVRMTANLRHANIVSLFDSGESDGVTYFVMPFIEGETLRDRLSAQAALGETEALRVMRGVLAGLEYAHTKGVVHRDVKPSNIMLSKEDVLLADFGIARLKAVSDADLTETGVIIGTPEYMSPEQGVAGALIDASSDVYSAGCVLAEMLTGRRLVPAGMRRQLAKVGLDPEPGLLASQLVELPALRDCVTRAIALDRQDRFQTAADFSAALEVAASAPNASALERSASHGSVASDQSGIASIRTAGGRVQGRSLAARWILICVCAIGVTAVLLRFRASMSPPLIDPRRVVIFPLALSGAQSGDTTFGVGVKEAILGALNSTGYVKPFDAMQLTGSLRAASGTRAPEGRASLASRASAAIFVDGLWERSDSIRVQIVVHGTRKADVTHLLTFPLGASAWVVGLRAATILLPSIIDVGTTTDLASLARRMPVVASNFLQGEQSYRAARFAEAVTHFKQAVRDDSSFGLAALRGAQAASWSALSADASALIVVALRDTIGASPQFHDLSLGFNAYFHDRADSAVRYLKKVLARDPQSAEAWMALGEVYTHLLPSEIPLDSLAELAFRRVRELDRTFVPVLYHLIEIEVRHGRTPAAESLLREFALAGADSAELRPIELMVRCVADGPPAVRWSTYSSSEVIEAARGLTVAGLRQPDCALAAWQHAFVARAPDQHWAALQGLQSVLLARGRFSEVVKLLDGDTTVNKVLRGWLYGIDAMAVSDSLIRLRAAEQADSMLYYFRAQPTKMGSQAMWHLGLWLSHTGRVAETRIVRDTLLSRIPGSTIPMIRYFERSLSARLALAQRDTVTAVTILRALTPFSDRASLTWSPEDAFGVDRLLLSEIEMAQNQPERARLSASYFDAGASVTFPIFLARSLDIRVRAESVFSDDLAVQQLRRRLDTLHAMSRGR